LCSRSPVKLTKKKTLLQDPHNNNNNNNNGRGSLCHTIKAHKVVESTAPLNLNLDSKYGQVVSFIPRPLYPRGNSPRHPCNRTLGGPQNSSCLVERSNPFTAISKFKGSFYALFQNMNL